MYDRVADSAVSMIKEIDIWNKDNKKREIAEKDGYKVIYIWEEEMKGDLVSLLLSKIINNIGMILYWC